MTTEVQARESVFTRLKDYLRETRVELRKVVWPTREQTLNLSGVVLLVTLAMTLYLGLLDSLLNGFFRLLYDLVQGG